MIWDDNALVVYVKVYSELERLTRDYCLANKEGLLLQNGYYCRTNAYLNIYIFPRQVFSIVIFKGNDNNKYANLDV